MGDEARSDGNVFYCMDCVNGYCMFYCCDCLVIKDEDDLERVEEDDEVMFYCTNCGGDAGSVCDDTDVDENGSECEVDDDTDSE